MRRLALTDTIFHQRLLLIGEEVLVVLDVLTQGVHLIPLAILDIAHACLLTQLWNLHPGNAKTSINNTEGSDYEC